MSDRPDTDGDFPGTVFVYILMVFGFLAYFAVEEWPGSLHFWFMFYATLAGHFLWLARIGSSGT